jgi:hypothetical protein
VLKSLENLTAKFANWGKTIGDSKGFKSFVAYLRRVGPKVTTALGDIAVAVGDIVLAFAPIGGVVLAAIDGLARAIDKIPAQALTVIAGAIVGIVAALKLLGPLTSALDFAIANPEVAAVLALGAAFVVLYTQSKPLRGLLGDLGNFFKTQLLPIIEQAAKQVLPQLKPLSMIFRSRSRKTSPSSRRWGSSCSPSRPPWW